MTRIVSSYERGRLHLNGLPRPQPEELAESDADGHFRLTAPEIGMWRLRVTAEDRLPAETDLMPLLDRRELESIRLRSATLVTVGVQDPQGKPLAGAWVLASHVGRRSSVRTIWRTGRRLALTNESGIARLPRATDETIALLAAAAEADR